MNNFILLLLLWSLIECDFRKVSVYDEFIKGVKEGLKLILVIFPVLLVLTLWVNFFQCCGIVDILEELFAYVVDWLQLPVDILMMCFIRPISSQGAMVVLKSIYDHYGVDHSLSILGSIIQTGSDTTLYVVSLYFQAIHSGHHRSVLWLGLFLDMIACVMALFCYYHFLI